MRETVFDIVLWMDSRFVVKLCSAEISDTKAVVYSVEVDRDENGETSLHVLEKNIYVRLYYAVSC